MVGSFLLTDFVFLPFVSQRLMKTHKQCCSGSDIVDWIIKNLRLILK